MENHAHSSDVCIVCALPEEAKAFLQVVQPYCEGALEESFSSRYHYSYRTATIKNNKDELLNLHISWLPRYGPQEMTLHLSRVLEECQPRIVIMTGICAGDSQQTQLGDLVVAERTFAYDNGKFRLDEHNQRVHLHDTLTYQLASNILQFLGLYDDWKPLVACLERPSFPPEQREIVCHIKAMASGSAVRADKPFEDVRAPVRGAVAIDMESAAFGLVMSHHPQIPWLVVKGVCDYADRDKNDAYHDYAARTSALYALSFVQKYVISEIIPHVITATEIRAEAERTTADERARVERMIAADSQRERTSDPPPSSRNQAQEDNPSISRSAQGRPSSVSHHVPTVASTSPRPFRGKVLLSGLISAIVLVLVITSLLVFRPGKETGRGVSGTPTSILPPLPTLVQKSFQNQHANFIAVTVPSPVMDGNLLLVAVTQYIGAVSSVTDNHRNIYTRILEAQHANSSTDFAQMYYARVVGGGITTVTVRFSVAGDKNVGVYEYSRLDPISPLDGVVTNAGFGSTPNGGTLKTAKENELVFVVGVDDNGNNSAPSAGSGYILEDHQDDSSSHERYYVEDKIAAHGSYQTTFSIAAKSDWAVIGASFKPAQTFTSTPTSLSDEVCRLI